MLDLCTMTSVESQNTSNIKYLTLKNTKDLDITLFCAHKYYTLLFIRQLMFVAVFDSQWSPNDSFRFTQPGVTNFTQPGITNGLVLSSCSKGFSSLVPTCSGSFWREEG